MKENTIARDCLNNDEIECPDCQSNNYWKYGKFRDGRQKYKCKNCQRAFTRLSLTKEKIYGKLVPEISPQEMKLLDYWDLRVFGKKPAAKGSYGVNFKVISPDWLKQKIKDFVWSKIAISSTSTIIHYVGRLKLISNFAQVNNIYLNPGNINRSFVIDLINYKIASGVTSKTASQYLAVWKEFFEFCQENGVIPKSHGKLIFDDDYPKRKKSQVKDIPDYVLKQLKTKISILAKPVGLIVEILIETGMRINEVCTLNFNCLQQDSEGDWWLNFYRSKVEKESRLVITKELASKILEQQKFLTGLFKNKFDKLFCSTENCSWFQQYGNQKITNKRRELNHFIPVAKPIYQATVRGYLKQLAHEHDIKDISGEIYPIWKSHRFRHTHLTNLARKGVGIAHIMDRAGHACSRMSMQYVHLTNDDQKKKMKEVWDNTHFNMEGEIVAPVNPDLDTAEMQWIKKGMGVQTTDNGYCTLLWTQNCPHQQLPCKECGSWVTTLEFLDSHKKELEETEKIIENARQKNWQRQIEKNVPRAERLKKIISGMEKHQTVRGIGHNEWEKEERLHVADRRLSTNGDKGMREEENE